MDASSFKRTVFSAACVIIQEHVSAEGLARPGRYRPVAPSLEVREVTVGSALSGSSGDVSGVRMVNQRSGLTSQEGDE